MHAMKRARDFCEDRRRPRSEAIPNWMYLLMDALVLMSIICWGTVLTALTGHEDY